MRIKFLFLTTGMLVTEAAVAQPRITSFDSTGELVWTNSLNRGLYTIESGSAPAGPWSTVGSVVDLDSAKTNRITLQVPTTNAAAYYRVAWIPPNPVGVWDYRGYDNQGTLVITGQLSLPTSALISSNPSVVYGIQGTWSLQYAGPPTNNLYWLGPQVGTGPLAGTLEYRSASLTLSWPSNVHDNNMWVQGDVWSNTYTGLWAYIGFAPIAVGRFIALRMSSTNLANPGPEAREVGKRRDDFQ